MAEQDEIPSNATDRMTNKRKRTEGYIEREAKKMKAELAIKEFFDTHGPTIWVCVFKISLDKITKEEFKQIRDKLVTFQLEEDIELNTTKIVDEPGKRLLKFRVHSKVDRLTLHELITRVTKGTYSTFSYNDLDDDEMGVIRLKTDNRFPAKYLTAEKLPELLKPTLGKYLKNQANRTEISVILPPAILAHEPRMIFIYIAVDKDTYTLLKTCNKKIQLVSYTLWIELVNKRLQGNEATEVREQLESNSNKLGTINIKFGGENSKAGQD